MRGRRDWEFFDEAPTRYQASEVIEASPAHVFAVLVDAGAVAGMGLSRSARVEYTSPAPLDVGSTRSVFMRGGLVGDEEFIAWEPGSRLAFRFNEMSKPGMGGC